MIATTKAIKIPKLNSSNVEQSSCSCTQSPPTYMAEKTSKIIITRSIILSLITVPNPFEKRIFS